MSKYIVETFYTCSFKIVHKLDELNEKKLSELENRNDGEVQIIDVKLNNRKTRTTDKKEIVKDSQKKTQTKNISGISPKFIPNIIRAATMYRPTMQGTNLDATFAILLIPPKITNPTSPDTIKPVMIFPVKALS